MFDRVKKKKDPLESDNELMLSSDSDQIKGGIIANPQDDPRISPREEAERISKGIELPRHLGGYTVEMIVQELFSLANIKAAFRDAKWHKRASDLQLLISTIKDPNQQRRINSQYNDYINRYRK